MPSHTNQITMGSAMAPAPLELSKRNLTFTLATDDDPIDVISVRNHSDVPQFFKVKTTNPHRYIVRPNLGLVQPNASLDITIALHSAAHPGSAVGSGLAIPADPPAPGPSKDKFLFQSATATCFTKDKIADEGNSTLPSPTEFWATVDITNGSHPVSAIKLRVNFIGGLLSDAANSNPSAYGTNPVSLAATAMSSPEPVIYSTVSTSSLSPPDGTITTGRAVSQASHVLPNADELLTPGNAHAAKATVETLQKDVDQRSRTLAAMKTELRETQAEALKVIADAPRTPLAANALITDPFGGISVAAIAIFILLFAVIVMTLV